MATSGKTDRVGTLLIEPHAVPPAVQLVKSVCHAPLGMFSILAPYPSGSQTTDWAAPPNACRDVLVHALDALPDARLVPAEVRVSSILDLLHGWREELGEEERRPLYAVILVIWTTEVRNQHELIVRSVTDRDLVDDGQVILAVGEPDEDTIPIALDNLARIVRTKITAAAVFTLGTPEDERLGEALTDPTDLLADSTARALHSCPPSAQRRPAAATR